MKTITKTLVGTAAAAAVALTSAAPAMARDNDGIDAGTVIAGALIVGGIAAVASAASRDDSYSYSRAGYGNGWGYGDRYNRGNSRDAVERCVRTAENEATRYGYRRADVTDVRDIRRTSRGYEVRGRIAVDGGNYGRYDRGWNGWNDRNRGYDTGSFKCKVEYGRVVDLDYSDIRGL